MGAIFSKFVLFFRVQIPAQAIIMENFAKNGIMGA